jgi:alkylation response protein AidB-like acyl-CoA dehydrogenase
VSRAAFELARDYAKQRQAFGAPIATKQVAFALRDGDRDRWRACSVGGRWFDSGQPALRESVLAQQQTQRVARSQRRACKCSAATATSASTCPRCSCETLEASARSKP